MLCLTVYESKGLEFEDVILYNFFDCGDASEAQWKLLHDLEYEVLKIAKIDEDILELDMLDPTNFAEF
jgi:ATP-dependent exoDNAse (exonuclease V) beta subunit